MESLEFLTNMMQSQVLDYESQRHGLPHGEPGESMPVINQLTLLMIAKAGPFSKPRIMPEYSNLPVLGPNVLSIKRWTGVYVGQYKEGQPHGFGVWISEDGIMFYHGFWKNGQPNGFGIDCDISFYYVGDFVNCTGTGKGKRLYIRDHAYEGDFKNNQPEGYGIHQKITLQLREDHLKVYEKPLEYIDCYKGTWSKGEKHGFGYYTDKKGSMFKQLGEKAP